MRIGLYGMPTSGKTYILDKIDFMEVIVGSKLLKQFDPDFGLRDEVGREKDRKAVARLMMSKKEFIMDGHYAFGDEVAFTEEEGEMYDIYIYLYINPDILAARMEHSEKNEKYLKFDLRAWQEKELNELRKYCHKHRKDFYVIDNPPSNSFTDVTMIIDFIRDIKNGYSCITFAEKSAKKILDTCSSNTIVLLDGDKTITTEDTSGKFLEYKTNLYDGNFYTGYQAWKQEKEFCNYHCPTLDGISIKFNEKIINRMNENSFILTSGHKEIWGFISDYLKVPCFCGTEMCAETKLYITEILQQAGKQVVAYGDGMNDYYMLMKADEGYLALKPNGKISKSLIGKEIGGLKRV